MAGWLGWLPNRFFRNQDIPWMGRITFHPFEVRARDIITAITLEIKNGGYIIGE